MNTLEKLIFNLRTIATIPKGKRISTTEEFINIEEESWVQGWTRKARNESRDKAVMTVCKEVRTAIILCIYIAESVHMRADEPNNMRDRRTNELRSLHTALTDVMKVGIDHLIETYDDANVRAGLLPLIGEINNCLIATA